MDIADLANKSVQDLPAPKSASLSRVQPRRTKSISDSSKIAQMRNVFGDAGESKEKSLPPKPPTPRRSRRKSVSDGVAAMVAGFVPPVSRTRSSGGSDAMDSVPEHQHEAERVSTESNGSSNHRAPRTPRESHLVVSEHASMGFTEDAPAPGYETTLVSPLATVDVHVHGRMKRKVLFPVIAWIASMWFVISDLLAAATFFCLALRAYYLVSEFSPYTYNVTFPASKFPLCVSERKGRRGSLLRANERAGGARASAKGAGVAYCERANERAGEARGRSSRANSTLLSRSIRSRAKARRSLARQQHPTLALASLACTRLARGREEP
jgi:hypothetical protein